MKRPACMTEAEWAEWNAPFVIIKDAGRAQAMVTLPPPRGHPCLDCPVAFHHEQRAAGTCDGFPRPEGGRQSKLTPEEATERRRRTWRESARRQYAKRRGVAA